MLIPSLCSPPGCGPKLASTVPLTGHRKVRPALGGGSGIGPLATRRVGPELATGAASANFGAAWTGGGARLAAGGEGAAGRAGRAGAGEAIAAGCGGAEAGWEEAAATG